MYYSYIYRENTKYLLGKKEKKKRLYVYSYIYIRKIKRICIVLSIYRKNTKSFEQKRYMILFLVYIYKKNTTIKSILFQYIYRKSVYSISIYRKNIHITLSTHQKPNSKVLYSESRPAI